MTFRVVSQFDDARCEEDYALLGKNSWWDDYYYELHRLRNLFKLLQSRLH